MLFFLSAGPSALYDNLTWACCYLFWFALGLVVTHLQALGVGLRVLPSFPLSLVRESPPFVVSSSKYCLPSQSLRQLCRQVFYKVFSPFMWILYPQVFLSPCKLSFPLSCLLLLKSRVSWTLIPFLLSCLSIFRTSDVNSYSSSSFFSFPLPKYLSSIVRICWNVTHHRSLLSWCPSRLEILLSFIIIRQDSIRWLKNKKIWSPFLNKFFDFEILAHVGFGHSSS